MNLLKGGMAGGVSGVIVGATFCGLILANLFFKATPIDWELGIVISLLLLALSIALGAVGGILFLSFLKGPSFVRAFYLIFLFFALSVFLSWFFVFPMLFTGWQNVGPWILGIFGVFAAAVVLFALLYRKIKQNLIWKGIFFIIPLALFPFFFLVLDVYDVLALNRIITLRQGTFEGFGLLHGELPSGVWKNPIDIDLTVKNSYGLPLNYGSQSGDLSGGGSEYMFVPNSQDLVISVDVSDLKAAATERGYQLSDIRYNATVKVEAQDLELKRNTLLEENISQTLVDPPPMIRVEGNSTLLLPIKILIILLPLLWVLLMVYFFSRLKLAR